MRNRLSLLSAFLFALLIALPVVAAAPSPGFGVPGEPAFANFEGPADARPAEPTIGIPWNTDNAFYQAFSTTYRITFDAAGGATWTDVTPPYQVPINLDPMLHVDPDTNRIWAGGLLGPCSVMMYSDDDGATWLPAGNMCSGARFDHQSIGSGPPAGLLPAVGSAHVAYYCGQLGAIACARSLDGGVTWLPFQDVPGPCGGFHGHIRVSRATGFVGVPVPDCGGDHGFISTRDGGLTWQSQIIPDTPQWTNGFDPSLQFTRPSGWMYYGMAGEHGIHIALTKDEGASWEPLGAGMGVEATHWLDVGQFHDPPIVAGTFADVQAGDDDRVAFSFMGLEGGPDADLEFLNSNAIYRCDARQEELVWHYYAAFSYDAGQTWSVNRISEDPVQVGGVYDSVVGGGGGCRNLLDFNDMAIDSTGRVHIAYADGCIGECAETAAPDTDGYRVAAARLYRQVAGQGLFAAFDVASPGPVEPTLAPPPEGGGRGIPGFSVGILLAGIGVALLARRH